jgi:hypothetical protein
MPISLYDATVPLYLQVLPAIGGLIDKAEAHCREAGLPDSALSEASLAPDMWHFARQVQIACMHSAAAVEGALSGKLTPDFTPPATDFASLRARVADAIARLKTITPAQLEAVIGRDTVFAMGETRRFDFTAEDFLLSFALPNFTFHATTAYAILRMKGLPIGKGDFLGKIRMKPQG